jgi:hypothetical protein
MCRDWRQGGDDPAVLLGRRLRREACQFVGGGLEGVTYADARESARTPRRSWNQGETVGRRVTRCRAPEAIRNSAPLNWRVVSGSPGPRAA